MSSRVIKRAVGAFGIPTLIPAEPRLYGAQLTVRF